MTTAPCPVCGELVHAGWVHIGCEDKMEFQCACRFRRSDEFSKATLIESCGFHSEMERKLREQLSRARAALRDVQQNPRGTHNWWSQWAQEHAIALKDAEDE